MSSPAKAPAVRVSGRCFIFVQGMVWDGAFQQRVVLFLTFGLASLMVSTIRFHPIMVPIPRDREIMAITQMGA